MRGVVECFDLYTVRLVRFGFRRFFVGFPLTKRVLSLERGFIGLRSGGGGGKGGPGM